MKHNLLNLFFLICFIALIGCDDDKYRPENSDKENPDTFSGSCNVFTFGQETSEFEGANLNSPPLYSILRENIGIATEKMIINENKKKRH